MAAQQGLSMPEPQEDAKRLSKVAVGTLVGVPVPLSDILLWLLDDTFTKIPQKEITRAVRARGRRADMTAIVTRALARLRTPQGKGESTRPADATRLKEWLTHQYYGKRLRVHRVLGQGTKETNLKRPRDRGRFKSIPTYSDPKTMDESQMSTFKKHSMAQGDIVGKDILQESTSRLMSDTVIFLKKHADDHARTAQESGMTNFSNYDQGEVSSRNSCCTLHCIYPLAQQELAYLNRKTKSVFKEYLTQLEMVFKEGYRCMRQYLDASQKGLVKRFDACYAYHGYKPSWVFMNKCPSGTTIKDGERIGNIIPHVDTSATFGTVVILLSDVDEDEQFIVWDDIGTKQTTKNFHKSGSTVAFPGSTIHCTIKPSARPKDRYTLNLFF